MYKIVMVIYMKEKNNKIIVIINTIAIFLSMFLFSFIYEKLPNFLTAALFPVNESLFEHLKLMFTSFVLVSLITYVVLKIKDIKVNNYFLATFVSVISNIGLFFLIYLPLYNHFGENLILTMSLYFIVLVISEYIFYLIITKFKHQDIYNIISLILLPALWCLLIYFTFNPRRTDFFFDTVSEKYGINIHVTND